MNKSRIFLISAALVFLLILILAVVYLLEHKTSGSNPSYGNRSPQESANPPGLQNSAAGISSSPGNSQQNNTIYPTPTPYLNTSTQTSLNSLRFLTSMLTGDTGNQSTAEASLTPEPTGPETNISPTPVSAYNTGSESAYRSFSNLLGTLLLGNAGETPNESSPEASVTPQMQIAKGSSSYQNSSSSLVYYPQCDGPYDTYALPGGCDICQAGCGQTSLAMILSSYVDRSYTPPKVVDEYKTDGLYAACNGSKITDAKTILDNHGLQTTDLLYYSGTTNDDAIADFRQYLQHGWTIFALARYCSSGCGHFIWITDVDKNNNVYAYDPFYGRNVLPPPLNENQYNPYPLYKFAFGVKKPS